MKEYKNDDITVYWFPELCSHPGTCLKLLPEVFNKDAHPWVSINSASPEAIIACIDKCPSGALRYSLPEDSRLCPEIADGIGNISYRKPAAVRIKISGKGPLSVDGNTEVISPEGDVLRECSRMVLCGCGKTQNCPFCDGSHRNNNVEPI